MKKPTLVRGKGRNAPPPKATLERAVAAYQAAGGNRSEAARACGVPRKTYTDWLDAAQRVLKVQLGKVVDGRVDYVEAVPMPLPKRGSVARYILSSAQNNTHVHAGFKSLEGYCDWLNTFRKGDTCEIIVGTFSYALDAFGAKAVKRGSYESHKAEKLWYAPELIKYFRDESVLIAPGLVWCGEMNILPTALHPLTGLADYNGRNSNIVPHAKIAMESIASLADEATKFNYSTGCITLRNYIQKRVGIVAERKHTYGALLVEVDHEGNWYVRQLEIGSGNEVYDIGPRGYRGVKITGNKVDALKISAPTAQTFVDSILWGDIHAAEMDLDVRNVNWGARGLVDQLAPRRQFMADIFSMRSRGHHEINDFHRTYQKFADGEGGVEDEMRITADFLSEAHRSWCETIVVPANHDDHLTRWLNEAKPERDPLNAKYFMRLQYQILNAMDEGNSDFNVLEYALRQQGIPKPVRFLAKDESYVICKYSKRGGIEMGLHGHLGPNGARGSTQNLATLARPVTKGHDHKGTIRGPVYSAGACSLNFPYMKGPNGHSISHVLAFENAARQILTQWAGKCRA